MTWAKIGLNMKFRISAPNLLRNVLCGLNWYRLALEVSNPPAEPQFKFTKVDHGVRRLVVVYGFEVHATSSRYISFTDSVSPPNRGQGRWIRLIDGCQESTQNTNLVEGWPHSSMTWVRPAFHEIRFLRRSLVSGKKKVYGYGGHHSVTCIATLALNCCLIFPVCKRFDYAVMSRIHLTWSWRLYTTQCTAAMLSPW